MALNVFKRMVNPLVNFIGRKKVDWQLPDPPILIGGCGRSGTTLLLAIIGAHPHVYAIPDEKTALNHWYRQFGRNIPRIDRIYRHLIPENLPERARRWCEKSPENVCYFGEILEYFDEEVFLIHIVRDGRDVMLSKHPRAPDEYWVDPDRWVHDVRAGLEYRDHEQVLTIKYEELIAEFEDTVEQICQFLGEEVTDEILNWTEHTNVRENRAWFDSVSELHTDSIEKWKDTDDRERVEEVMSDERVVNLLEELDYR